MKRMLFCVALLLVAFGCSDEPELIGTYVPTDCPPCETAEEEPTTDEIVLEEEVNFDDEMVFAAHVHTADELGSQAEPAEPTVEEEPADETVPRRAEPATLDSGRVDLNRASPAELTTLPGVGPALAGRILEYRQRRAFDDPSEIVRVRGIGPATFEKLRARIVVD